VLKLIQFLHSKYNLPKYQIDWGVEKAEKCLDDFRNDVPKADEYFADIKERIKSLKITE